MTVQHKKILKISGGVVGGLIVLLLVLPFLFKDQIQARVTQAMNDNLNATVSFQDVSLSLLRNFPNATVTISDLKIVNKAPFVGDTLLAVKQLGLKMSITELFKGKESPLAIQSIFADSSKLNLIINKEGVGNYDIAIKKPAGEPEKPSSLSFKIKNYRLDNSRISFWDQASGNKIILDKLNHSGSGDFGTSKLDLSTQSATQVSVFMGKTNFMNKVEFKWEAVLGIDLANSTYTFKQNKAFINQLPLIFDGSIALKPEGQHYDITFQTPTSSFQNFLGLIPAAYAQSLEGVSTTGDFSVKGFAKGLLSDTTVPAFSVAMASKNASFQYPKLPKKVKDIFIDAQVTNTTGIAKDTYVQVNAFGFQIDQDIFKATAHVTNLTDNPAVTAQINGTLNLSNFAQAYPVKTTMPLSGMLQVALSTAFDKKAVDTNSYEKMKNSGSVILTGFNYADATKKVTHIHKAQVQFTNTAIQLKELNLTSGKSDVQVQGVLTNFYGYLFKNEVLKGNFQLQSQQLYVADFMTTETATPESTKPTALKIPATLACAVTAKVGKVYYDNLILENVSGKASIQNQAVGLEQIRAQLFQGVITADGSVSTQAKVPEFAMKLGMQNMSISQVFTQLTMLQKMAPIAKVVSGQFSSNIQVAGNLDALALTPDLKSISGDLMGGLSNTKITAENSPLLQKLDQQFPFLDVNKLNLNEIKLSMQFNKGQVAVKPFTLHYQDIGVTIAGNHRFDQNMNYTLNFDVPAKYVAKELNGILGKTSAAELAKLDNIPLLATLTGTFKAPKIKADTRSMLVNLTGQLAKTQKDKLVNQGLNALQGLLGTKKDSTKTNNTNKDLKEKAGKLLNGLFGK
ncbi:MAG: AsmA-like C-terminal region-containing protein [Flavobacterium sp.]|nr:AsmA-like C-terminal region-containing protein [Flavobacterium sp.]